MIKKMESFKKGEYQFFYHIVSGGYNTGHNASFMMSRPNGNLDYVLLVIKSRAKYFINEKEYKVMPSTAIILDKNIPYYYNPYGEYRDDWLHFLPFDEKQFREQLVFNEFFPVLNMDRISHYIQLILYENTYANKIYQKENVSFLMQAMLNNLIVMQQEKDLFSSSVIYQEQLKELRLKIRNTPYNKFTVKELAEKMGISLSYFQHLYTQLFGISFQKDLIYMRVEYAKNILITTDLSIEQIAEQCGYLNLVHFYRQFKQITGITPNFFRKQNKVKVLEKLF